MGIQLALPSCQAAHVEQWAKVSATGVPADPGDTQETGAIRLSRGLGTWGQEKSAEAYRAGGTGGDAQSHRAPAFQISTPGEKDIDVSPRNHIRSNIQKVS